MLSENNNDDGAKLHLQEAENLKKEWYGYVLASIQKLNDRIDDNNLKMLKYKEEMLEFTATYKEEISSNFDKLTDKNKNYLSQLEKRIDTVINKISDKISTIEIFNTEFKYSLENIKTKLKTDFEGSISVEIKKQKAKDKESFDKIDDKLEFLKKQLDTVDKAQIITKTKLGVYIALTSLITTAIITTIAGGVLFLFQDALTKFLGLG